MRVLASSALACFKTVAFALGLSVRGSEAQSSDRLVRERIATIFQETLKRGEARVEIDGHLITARTFVPPSTEHVDEIRRYGKEAIPILTEYLRLENGFEQYLAMRFLGDIGGANIIGPLAGVALSDPSPGIRSTALRWLSVTRWDLASPIIRQAARDDSAAEVRKQAQDILAQH